MEKYKKSVLEKYKKAVLEKRIKQNEIIMLIRHQEIIYNTDKCFVLKNVIIGVVLGLIFCAVFIILFNPIKN